MGRRFVAGAAVAAFVVIAVLALAGGHGAGSHRDRRSGHEPVATRTGRQAASLATGSGGTGTVTTATTTATTPTSPTLTPASQRPDGPAQARLVRALHATLGPLGSRVGALVYDITAGRELAAIAPTVGRPPASVEKLWTTTAVLDRLGPGTRLHTTVLGTGELRRGVWHGNLYLHGGGDPTFGDPGFNRVWNGGQGPTPQQLIAQLRRAGIRRVTGLVYPDESLFDRRRGGLLTDYRADVPDFGGRLSALDYDHGTTSSARIGPAVYAVRIFVQLMNQAGIRARAATRDRTTPRTAQPLATVASPPMSTLLALMDVPSDDLFAELLAKQLGVLYGTGGTIAAGARVIAQTIAADYDLHPRILDGSGLGRADRTSPLQIVELLRDLWGTTVGREVAAALPVTGVSGTVIGIGARTAAQGRCQAKTGSLDNVSNLAGWCRTRNGHVLAFGLFVDGPDNVTGFAALSRIVGAMARY